MCRNITTLRGLAPPATTAEIEAAARQYVRKVSGVQKTSAATEAAFEQAVALVADATADLLDTLPPRRTPPRQDPPLRRRVCRRRRRLIRRCPSRRGSCPTWLAKPAATACATRPCWRPSGRCPRQSFVPRRLAAAAYDDGPLPIGEGQTISQPAMVAMMAEAAQLQPSDSVLEVGAGSGYGALVLRALAGRVVTIERKRGLAEKARSALAGQELGDVKVVVGDGTLGWPADAPYNAIVVTAAGPAPPPPLLQQLAPGGRLVMPVGPRHRDQFPDAIHPPRRHGCRRQRGRRQPCARRGVPCGTAHGGALRPAHRRPRLRVRPVTPTQL